MEEILTIDEIEEKYDGEWVLILDPEVGEAQHVLGGRVAYHSADRDEFDRRSLEFPAKHIAVRYCGAPDAEMEFIL